MNLSLAIISTSSLWDRTLALLSSSCLREYDFSVYSNEDKSFHSRYKYDQSTGALWEQQVKAILPGLLDNLARIRSQLTSLEFASPRSLSHGEISVISKHYRAINDFLNTDTSHLMVMEDDVIFNLHSLESVENFIASNPFDFVDFAGGDNIHCHESRLETVRGISGEKNEFKSTRTACCYLISKRFAYQLCACLYRPVLPIDWSISYALSLLQDSTVFWVEDKLFLHGSCIGSHLSWRSQC